MLTSNQYKQVALAAALVQPLLWSGPAAAQGPTSGCEAVRLIVSTEGDTFAVQLSDIVWSSAAMGQLQLFAPVPAADDNDPYVEYHDGMLDDGDRFNSPDLVNMFGGS